MKFPFGKKVRSSGLTVIIGCGRLGAELALSMSNEGRDVIVIDRDKDAFRKLPPSFGGITVTGDGTDFDTLHEVSIEKASTVIVVTDKDNTNIMIAQMLNEIFHTEKIIIRLYYPEREFIYEGSGIQTICPAVLSENEINRMLDRTVSAYDENTEDEYDQEVHA